MPFLGISEQPSRRVEDLQIYPRHLYTVKHLFEEYTEQMSRYPIEDIVQELVQDMGHSMVNSCFDIETVTMVHSTQKTREHSPRGRITHGTGYTRSRGPLGANIWHF